MSAIAGIYHLDGRQADPRLLDEIIVAQFYRGPDGHGTWLDGQIGLGHSMLWCTPESLHEHLPFNRVDGELALTVDARIDNREEIVQALELVKPLAEITDTEIILDAYEKWGEACPEKLIGDFAFAIWDRKEQKLFCARDPMGIKPFYYHYRQGHLFVFASQIGPLFCLPEVPRRINELRVAEHLAFLDGDHGQTFYQDIYQLPAAHCLSVDKAGLRLNQYWQLDPHREIHLSSEEAYADAFLEVFRESVKCRLRSAYPVGSLLSGGLDSSSIVVVARQGLAKDGSKRRLHTFSAVFPTLSEFYPKIDERKWIEAVVSQGGVEPHYILADGLNPLEAISYYDDEPMPIPNLWLDWGCFQAAHEAGLRTILSGFGGEATISFGAGYLAELARSFQFRTLLVEAKALAIRMNWPLSRLLKEQVLNILILPAAMRVREKFRFHQPPLQFPFDPPINPAFATRIGLLKHARSITGDAFPRFKSARDLHCQSIQSRIVLRGPELLDKTSARWSLELRLPFFDRRLLEFSLALPTGQKRHQGWNRYVVRHSMQGLLPSEVQWRKDKGNLSPNIRRGLLEYRQTLTIELLDNIDISKEFIDVRAIKAAYERFLSEPMQSTDSDIFTILVAFTLVQWMRRNKL